MQTLIEKLRTVFNARMQEYAFLIDQSRKRSKRKHPCFGKKIHVVKHHISAKHNFKNIKVITGDKGELRVPYVICCVIKDMNLFNKIVVPWTKEFS